MAGDRTAWSRPEAVTLPEGTVEHYTTEGGGIVYIEKVVFQAKQENIIFETDVSVVSKLIGVSIPFT